MFSVYRTLSFRYLQRRWLRAILIVASIALGVGTLVATRALNATMYSASLASTNPMAGEVDFVISLGEQPVSLNLIAEIMGDASHPGIAGVKSVRGCIFKDVYLPAQKRKATLMGLDYSRTLEDLKGELGKTIDLHPSMEKVKNFVIMATVKQKVQDTLKWAKAWAADPNSKEYRNLGKLLTSLEVFPLPMADLLLPADLNLVRYAAGPIAEQNHYQPDFKKETDALIERLLKEPLLIKSGGLDDIQPNNAERSPLTIAEFVGALANPGGSSGVAAAELAALMKSQFRQQKNAEILATSVGLSTMGPFPVAAAWASLTDDPRLRQQFPSADDLDRFREQLEQEKAIACVRFTKATLRKELEASYHPPPAIIGKALDDELPKLDFDADQSNMDINNLTLVVQKSQYEKKEFKLLRVGYLEASDAWAALGGYTILLDLSEAAHILDMQEGEVSRLDVKLEPGANLVQVRAELEKRVGERANVRTPDEQNQTLHNAMSGMQTGFSLCGVAALVVGVFLVYNSLSVSVAERRHEIGILLAVGATRWQVRGLFAGEAAILGLTGSLLGIPLGLGLAKIGLAPMRKILSEIFKTLHTREVEISPMLMLLAVLAGLTTSVAAALIPAWQASLEKPAEAVRRIPKMPTLHHLVAQIVTSVSMAVGGIVLILLRSEIPYKFGTYGGLVLVLIGALVASPIFAALCARLFQPLARRFLSIEWRLAADNLVRSPGRTGLVIGALAAGVSLVVQTAGTIRSNRLAMREWVQNRFDADLFITAGGFASAGESLDMDEADAEKLRKFPEVEAVLPIRKLKVDFGKDFQIYLLAVNAGENAAMERRRLGPAPSSDLMQQLSEHPDSVIMSENFAAFHHIKKGETITLPNGKRGVRLHVIGQIVDYNWNHGSLIMNRRDYLKHWQDDKANEYDIYLKKGADHAAVKDRIHMLFGERLSATTRIEVQDYIEGMIERIYGIAYGQQIVVMLVAALGVVTALLISVLQRRRELGLLRAIGASQIQVIYSVLSEACLMGVIGTVIGIAVGIPLQWYVLRVMIFEESGYLFPMYIPWVEGCVIALAALTTATLAGLGPAIHAVRMRIPEAIAYE